MKFLKFIFFSLLGFVGLYLLACVFMPDRFEVSRSIDIDASPFVIFEQVNDFKNWQNWEPWARQDSTIVNTNGEITAGEDAYREWTSEQSGNGNMTITNSELLQQIDFELNISEWNTFYGHFTFEASETGVQVTWVDEGDLPFLMRGMGPVFDVMMGGDFESGLANLKEYCENVPARTGDISIVKWETQPYVYILDSCSVANIGPKLGALYGEIYQSLASQGMMPVSQPFARYIRFPHQAGDEDKVVLQAGAFMETDIATEGRIQLGYSTTGKTAQASHFGAYETSDITHGEMHSYCAKNNLTAIGSAYEIYLTDPGMEPNQANWETRIIYELE